MGRARVDRSVTLALSGGIVVTPIGVQEGGRA